MDQLALAYRLIGYGREHKSAEALLLAADILEGIQTRKLEAKVSTEKSDKAGESDKAEPEQPTPKSLRAEAKKLGKAEGGDKLAARGAVGGPMVDFGALPSYSRQTVELAFRGNETAHFRLEGDGDTDVDCYVHDEYGTLIVADVRPTDICNMVWYPARTEAYRITLVNRGSRWNWISVITN